jgi:hypothetical protein
MTLDRSTAGTPPATESGLTEFAVPFAILDRDLVSGDGYLACRDLGRPLRLNYRLILFQDAFLNARCMWSG